MVAGNKQEPVVDEVVKEKGVEQGNTVPSVEIGTDIKQGSEDKGEVIESDSCSGRYVYIHDLPSRFNEDMLKNCQSLSAWTDMCLYLSNMGLGPRLSNSERAFSNTGWFGTNQFSLEELKDTASSDISKWLAEQPEWKEMWGRNHFAVAGRISWDFRRQTNILSQWGNGLMYLPAFKNMTIMRRQRRRFLFSFAGAPRPNLPDSIRNQIIDQCSASRRKCKLLECGLVGSNRMHTSFLPPRVCLCPIFMALTQELHEVLSVHTRQQHQKWECQHREDTASNSKRGILERVETVRRDMREGRNSSFAFDEEMSWKYYLLGTDSAKHEWDPFFDKANANF
ncbi:hypothetical protein PVL29_007497 [Vitis rotundifolia]|uniref:Exostosin GT47 domain-containing protein n=1 Tax=Vitis rotundifolia TaxID=103349 RepID=A0AA39DVG3_VITRO|nr:hypothetical protein PVL29_007497 [Vitis rotundifolia]